MNNILKIICFVSIFTGSVFASSSSFKLFDTPNKGDIVYYDGGHFGQKDYSNILQIKEKLLKSGNEVHSITIADILGKGGVQCIVLSENKQSREKKVVIYSHEMVIFEYILSPKYLNDVRVAIDIESFENKKKKVAVIKLYVMKEDENDKKTIDLHMFISYNNKINIISDIMFYKQVNSPNPFVSKADIVFVDIDGDNTVEMIVLLSEEMAERKPKKEYLRYEFDYMINNYVCVSSSWYDNSTDYSKYFSN